MAATVLAGEPPRTGHPGVDLSFAALACWWADRDGWTAPAWALTQSPGQFRIRGVFITDTARQRV